MCPTSCGTMKFSSSERIQNAGKWPLSSLPSSFLLCLVFCCSPKIHLLGTREWRMVLGKQCLEGNTKQINKQIKIKSLLLEILETWNKDPNTSIMSGNQLRCPWTDGHEVYIYIYILFNHEKQNCVCRTMDEKRRWCYVKWINFTRQVSVFVCSMWKGPELPCQYMWFPRWWYCWWKLEEVESLSQQEMGHWGKTLKQTCSRVTYLFLELEEDSTASLQYGHCSFHACCPVFPTMMECISWEL